MYTGGTHFQSQTGHRLTRWGNFLTLQSPYSQIKNSCLQLQEFRFYSNIFQFLVYHTQSLDLIWFGKLCVRKRLEIKGSINNEFCVSHSSGEKFKSSGMLFSVDLRIVTYFSEKRFAVICGYPKNEAKIIFKTAAMSYQV